jgi:hypothetical protein
VLSSLLPPESARARCAAGLPVLPVLPVLRCATSTHRLVPGQLATRNLRGPSSPLQRLAHPQLNASGRPTRHSASPVVSRLCTASRPFPQWCGGTLVAACPGRMQQNQLPRRHAGKGATVIPLPLSFRLPLVVGHVAAAMAAAMGRSTGKHGRPKADGVWKYP